MKHVKHAVWCDEPIKAANRRAGTLSPVLSGLISANTT
jgi:hypothetical protein